MSCNSSIKQFQVIQCEVPLPPDEINDTYIDINKELQMNINVYSGLTILDFRIWLKYMRFNMECVAHLLKFS